jgi:hypothetical protein
MQSASSPPPPTPIHRHWQRAEDTRLGELVSFYGDKDWSRIWLEVKKVYPKLKAGAAGCETRWNQLRAKREATSAEAGTSHKGAWSARICGNATVASVQS